MGSGSGGGEGIPQVEKSATATIAAKMATVPKITTHRRMRLDLVLYVLSESLVSLVFCLSFVTALSSCSPYDAQSFEQRKPGGAIGGMPDVVDTNSS